MRIAQVAPLYEAVPPRLYGGTERVVAHLTDALVTLGHDVTLFSSAEAQTLAKLAVVRDQAIRLDPAPLKSDLAAHLNALAEVRRRADEFDVIHFHTDMIQFPMFGDMPERTLTTLHGRLDLKDLPEIYRRWSRFPLISISDDQRKPLPFANWAATVHHGMTTDLYRFSPQAARLPGLPRPHLAGEAAGPGDRHRHDSGPAAQDRRQGGPRRPGLFRDQIDPLLRHPLVEFVGEIGDAEKSDFLGGADALLFPIDWPEPFGLVMIEAMACGTPVIAWDNGSVPEVIEDGVTGFIVRSQAEALAAVERLPSLDRRAIRARFEERFSATAMARRYLEIYERVPRSRDLTEAA